MPIIREEKSENGCRWAIWRIEESIDELMRLSNNATVHEKAIKQFPHERRKLEYLATRLLTAYLTRCDSKIDYLPNGKPFLADGSFQLSLSHTIGYAAAMIHPTNNIGIDIEAVSPRILKVKGKFLSTKELENINPKEEIMHLLLHWSAKESVFKAMGEEEVDFKENMQIEPFNPQTEGTFFLNETRTIHQKTYPIHYCVNKDFVLTWTL